MCEGEGRDEQEVGMEGKRDREDEVGEQGWLTD